MTGSISASALSAELAGHVDIVVKELLPNAVVVGCGYFQVGSVAGEAGRSLYIHRTGARAGKWIDEATGEYGDLLDLIQAVESVDLRGAIAWACDFLRICGRGISYEKRGRCELRWNAKPKPAEQADIRRRVEFARRIWRASEPAVDSLVHVYLKSRGITQSPPLSLRYHPNLMHPPTNLRMPAMIGAIQNGGGEITAIHRTWLEVDGSQKAHVSSPKMMIGLVRSGAVRLAEAGEYLVVSEGIETGLSVHQATELPTWAALSAGGIEALILPTLPLATTVTIAADHDERGLVAAEKAAERWVREGRTIRIAKPSQPGTDFNDALSEATA